MKIPSREKGSQNRQQIQHFQKKPTPPKEYSLFVSLFIQINNC